AGRGRSGLPEGAGAEPTAYVGHAQPGQPPGGKGASRRSGDSARGSGSSHAAQPNGSPGAGSSSQRQGRSEWGDRASSACHSDRAGECVGVPTPGGRARIGRSPGGGRGDIADGPAVPHSQGWEYVCRTHPGAAAAEEGSGSEKVGGADDGRTCGS